MPEQSIFSAQVQIYSCSEETKKWEPIIISTFTILIAILREDDDEESKYATRIVSVDGSKALINSTVVPGMLSFLQTWNKYYILILHYTQTVNPKFIRISFYKQIMYAMMLLSKSLHLMYSIVLGE